MLMNRKAKTVNVLEGPMTESCAEFPARHVFIKCPECRRVIDETRLHDNLEVCPRCGKHFRVSGRARMRMTVDEGTFEEWDANLASEDFLSFPGYADKLKHFYAALFGVFLRRAFNVQQSHLVKLISDCENGI